MTNRVIFLDIDGPLLPGRMWYHPENAALRRDYGANWWREIDEHPDFFDRITFDPIAVTWFNLWVKYSGAKVVIASNWRRWLDKIDLEEVFKNNGLRINLHEDWQTMGHMTSNRINEIGMWMDDHPDYEALVVEDDSEVSRCATWFKNGKTTDEKSWMHRAWLIDTDYNNGITLTQFSEGMKFLEVPQEKILESMFGIIPLTEEEEIQRQKDLELLLSCMC